MRLRSVLPAFAASVVLPVAVPATVTAQPAPAAYVYFSDTTFAGPPVTRVHRTAVATGARETVVAAGAFAARPVVSPDGTRVAYVADAAGAGTYDVYVRTLATGATVRVARSDDDELVDDPAWSPDGTRLAFTHFQFGTERYSVREVRADGSAPPTAVAGTLDALHPAYSPSGRQLAVTVVPRSAPTALAVVTRGSGTRGTVAGTSHGADPAWSPDGTRLAFTRYTATGSYVAAVPVRGGPATALTAGTSDTAPAYSPDGRHLYFARGRDVSTVRRLDLAAGGASVAAATGEWAAEPSVEGPRAVPDTAAGPAPEVAVSVGAGRVTARVLSPAADWSEIVVRRGAAGAPAPATVTDGAAVADGYALTATATGLTGATYGFSVFAVDAAGNVSPPASFTATPVAVPAVTTPAVVSTAGATRTWTVRWAVPPAGGTAASYDVEYGTRERSATGAWSAVRWRAWRPLTAATSGAFTGAPGATYWFRVRARNAQDQVTAWSAAAASSVPLDDSAAAYSTGWTAVSSAQRWLGTYRAVTAAGRTATLSAETAGFAVVGDTCASCGQVRVYVDGVLRATVDTRSSATLVRRTLWSVSFSGGIRTHTIRLVPAGTAGRPRVVLDGIALRR